MAQKSAITYALDVPPRSPSKLALSSDEVAASYSLVERLGTGATSEVWRATLIGSQDPVVLKVAKHAEHARALASEALVSTLALSPRLPHLVALGTLSVTDATAVVAPRGRAFIAFRDTGTTSMDTLQIERNATLALRIARDVGEALADLHAVGLAHGDVKPQNVTLGDSMAYLIDLGLSGPAHQHDVRGATPRYLARGDRRLGDALARDLLALGLLIAELACAEVHESEDPLACARSIALDPSIAPLCAALLAPEPGARPSARWVHRRASTALGEPTDAGTEERHTRRVRAAYLRLRRRELAGALTASSDTAPWVAETLAHHAAARAMCGAAGVEPPVPLATEPDRNVQPLPLCERQRWLVSLVGSAAAAWPADTIRAPSEPQLASALEALATRVRPEIWTLRDVESALTDEAPKRAPRAAAPSTLDASGAALLAVHLHRMPTDWAAIEMVETHASQAPEALTLLAADALRLAGQLGRARSLIADAHLGRGRGCDVTADILRRCGDTQRAAEFADQAIACGADPNGRARACLARIHYEEGSLDRAAEIVGTRPEHAATAEVAALIQAARGAVAEALSYARRGYSLASTPESRARLSATIAFIQRGQNTGEACRRFRAAAVHAVQAGAVLEEASYRTGEASACVDVGDLEGAIAAADRAALLWEEVLDRPSMSARAWLARAAAFAAVDAVHEATLAAERASMHASECGDARAEAYAWWVVADVAEPGSACGAAAAHRARALVDGDGDDDVQGAARILRHAPTELSAAQRQQLDGRCRHAAAKPASSEARLAWWGARAIDLLMSGAAADSAQHDRCRQVVSELCALADADAPVEAVGRAMHTGACLAAALSETDALERLSAARHDRAARVREGTRGHLAESARSCSWVVGRNMAPAIDASHAIDLRQLVLALSERNSLRKLLDRVLDVLLTWTGAERGLLLMKTPESKLVPRAARNLSRADLQDEQLLVSTSLAERALSTGEPVVAIDAMEELSSSYDSVHALKLRSVLALPLAAHGEVLGVVYLDDRLRRGAFGDKELAWAQSVAPVAALAIADARAQVQLRRAAKSADRAARKLEKALARKETELDVAERELARAAPVDSPRQRHPDIIGESEPMTQLLRLTDRVAASDVPVLLLGESGSGKELIARALHRRSPRRDAAFVGENCGALPETLLESTLFGHTKGAFTGAHRHRVGLFEAADGGTLLLDEIGEMSMGMQTKLLRILEDNLVRPVGSTRSRKVDVRVVAATHRDLEKMVAEGTFRQDLYYRLNVIAIRIPALRERPADIRLLVDHLIRKHAPSRQVQVSESAYARLRQHSWPGNVRQLENEVRRALLLADDTIEGSHLSIGDTEGDQRAALGLDLRARVDHLEVQLVEEAMGRTAGNQTQAARLLGVSRYGLHKMMKRLGIAPHKRHRDATVG